MAPVIYLTTGLCHVPTPRPFKPGEVFITRFKNALRGYKTDVWFGVVLPHKFGPARHISRPPVGAQPEEGEWHTHLKDRVYPMYLPARNMYRWAPLHDIFVFNEKTINIMNRAQRQEEGKVWEKLATLIKTKPSLEFWKNMSMQELGAKGNRGREVRIIKPREEKDEEGESDEDQSKEDEEEMEDPEAATPGPSSDQSDGASPPKVQAVTRSFSDSKKHLTQFNGPTTVNGGGLYELRDRASKLNLENHPLPASNSRALNSLEKASLAPVANAPNISVLVHPEALSEIHPMIHAPSSPFLCTNSHTMASLSGSHSDPFIKMENSSGAQPAQSANQQVSKPTIFNLQLRQALVRVFTEEPEADEILTLCKNLITVQNRAEIVQIRSFLNESEFLPRLVQFNYHNPTIPQYVMLNSEQDSKVPYLFGDKMQIGQVYRLDGVEDTNSLRDAITVLGALYEQAKNFNMHDLIYFIAYKLQVSWNSYSGVTQCKPLLEVATVVFKNDSSGDDNDFVQKWFITFIAETYELVSHECHDRLLALLRANPRLQSEVLESRTKLHLRQPQLFADTLALLKSRGVHQL